MTERRDTTERRERTYTTFQIADICNVRPTTIIKWANQNRIKAYTTPGGHRRIRQVDLIEFLKKYNFPIPGDLQEKPPRVLIVEDENDVGLLVSKALQRAAKDLDVQWTKDGVEALIAIGQQPPALVILDVEMPLVDGARVLATLRSDPQTQKIKVIGMTGKRLLSDKIKFMHQHTDGFFYKPFKVAELVQKSLELLGVPQPAKTTK